MKPCHVPPLATCDACMDAFTKQRREEANAWVDADNAAHTRRERYFNFLCKELEELSAPARESLVDILEDCHALAVEHPCCAGNENVERLLNFLRSTHFFKADQK